MKIKVFLVYGMTNYVNWIPNCELISNLDEADLVLFEGGADIDPSFYNTVANPLTGSDKNRDIREFKIFEQARDKNIPCLGICRGSQLLCVAAGGKLVQHQNNPSFIHDMHTIDGTIIKVSSTHHQAQYPFNLKDDEYQILGWTKDMLQFHEGGEREELNPPVECEVVYYPNINALAIQAHPEMINSGAYEETIEWFVDLLNKFLNKEL